MRYRVGSIVVWVLATLAGVGLAFAAIGTVVDRASQGPPPSFAVGTDGDGTGATPTPEDGRSPDDRQATGAGAAPTAAPTPGSVAAPPSQGSAGTEGETRTYDLVGGRAAIRFTRNAVELLWASPAPGFTVDVEREDGGSELSVEFRSEEHRSRVKAWAEEGRFRDRIEERPD